ncbi:MAG TPA: hypothetical protein VGD67_17990 [Pseudonocardiaceae bacterium]
MTDRARSSRHGLLIELFWTRTGLLILLMGITSAVLLPLSAGMAPGTARNLVTAIGTGTLVSALVTCAQTLLTSAASQRVLVDSLVEESRRAMRDLTDEYRSLNREFFPTHIFEPTAEPEPVLNRLMMADLQATRQYLFRGFSARHAAARMLLTRSVEREMRVVIADPRDRASINSRARYLQRHGGDDGAGSLADIQARLYEDVCVGLVGLYVVRGRCTRIDVTVMSNPPVDRFELFDDSIWVALFSDAGGTSTPYPRTVRFLRSSFIYGMEHSEFVRITSSRTALHVSIHPDTDREEFLALFEKITGRRLTARRLEALEERFHEFRRDFVTSAQLGG